MYGRAIKNGPNEFGIITRSWQPVAEEVANRSVERIRTCGFFSGKLEEELPGVGRTALKQLF